MLNFLNNPYEGFNISGYNIDLYGWLHCELDLKKIIESKSPKLIVEIGTFLGKSAITMANVIKKLNLNTKIICIDTWLGSLEHFNNSNWKSKLNIKNGFPQYYYQFIANVILSECKDIIIPFPNTSTAAYYALKKENIKPDIVYIDGSHEEDDVYIDLKHYYELLNNNGIIIGDDWFISSVQNAVNKFILEQKIPLEKLNESVWKLNKNS